MAALAASVAVMVGGGVLVYQGAFANRPSSAAPASQAQYDNPPSADPSAASGDDTTPSAAPSTSATPRGTSATTYVFPVKGKFSYAHTHHDYPATDIMSPCGTPVVAVTNGVVLEVNRVDSWVASVNAGATRGGLSVSILGDDGVRYYGSHFSSIESTVNAGVRVTAGQLIAHVGKTGDTTACHVHFGISPVCQRTGDWWIRRGVIWPWPYLDSWRLTPTNEKSAVAEISSWKQQHGCPTKPLVDP